MTFGGERTKLFQDGLAAWAAGGCVCMGKNDNYPDLPPGSGDDEEVEILEVVAVDDKGAEAAATPETVWQDDADPDECVLDFGDAEPGPETAVDALNDELSGDDEVDRERLRRLRADYENLRKRIDRERREFEQYASFGLVGRLLPVLDNLERALAADSNGDQGNALREGLVMIHRQLTDQLRDEGLRVIETVGQTFDPNLHDAVATDARSGEPANTIVEQMQTGYLFQSRVLRPALVKVSTGSGEDE